MLPALAASLDAVAAAAPHLEDDWWLFGSAGMLLLGVQGLDPPDVDLLVSLRDAQRLVALWGAEVVPGGGPLFRSTLFAKAAVQDGRPIEIMAGLQVREGAAWGEVLPRTRQAHGWNGGRLFTPSAAEQIEICRRFGRPKDLMRIAALESLP